MTAAHSFLLSLKNPPGRAFWIESVWTCLGDVNAFPMEGIKPGFFCPPARNLPIMLTEQCRLLLGLLCLKMYKTGTINRQSHTK